MSFTFGLIVGILVALPFGLIGGYYRASMER